MKQLHQSGVTRVTRQKTDRIEQLVRRYRSTTHKPPVYTKGAIRITPLGGQDGIGEKNMIVVEYGDDALILDCGFELGIDLPGINYAVPVVDYLKTIKHKIKGYVISHGHMDHIGGLVHVYSDFPAPIFGSSFTIGMVKAQFEKLAERGTVLDPDYIVMNMDAHERVKLGEFAIELVRVTHAVPESSAIVVDTPVGRIINTGDFRLDPEPLDAMPSDIARLKQLGDEGVLLLMSESTNTAKAGRTPTEHTLQDSFYELMERTHNRMIFAVFSTNMNRVQMIINAAHHYGRKVAIDGRSMIAVADLAVRLGTLKIPKGTLIPMREAVNVPGKDVVIICTGGQGEPGAALSRMAAGEHRIIKLKKSDSVVISSTPIPGNEQSYEMIGNHLAKIGVKQYRHPTHELDGSGPLHVSGHGARDEHAEMMQLTRPRYMMPIYGGALPRMYHKDVALKEGIAEQNIIMAENGDVIELSKTMKPKYAGKVTAGAHLVDTTGAIVPEVVTRDRMVLKDDGFLIIALTVDPSGRLRTSPDIVSRGFVSIKDNNGLLDGLRQEIRTLTRSRKLQSRAAIDVLKQELRITAMHYLFTQTAASPIIIPIVNVVRRDGSTNHIPKPVAEVHS